MAKKKYSKRTRESAYLYGQTQKPRWKKLSEKRIRQFLKAVNDAKGYINPASIESFAMETFAVYQQNAKKMAEAARRWAQTQRPEWERLTEQRLEEFEEEFEEWAEGEGIERPSADDAFDFAESVFVDFEEFEALPEVEKVYIVTNGIGWDNPDAIDNFLDNPRFIEIRIIDFDGSLVYSGPDRRDFWDTFRSLGGEDKYPYFEAYRESDEYGNIFITVQITGYYPD